MLIKRLFDLVSSFCGLVATSPVLVPAIVAVWLQDRHSPFYVAPRVARGGGIFSMVKLRSMVINADKTGVDSTGAADKRITAVGHLIRRFKLDELTQLWNVFIGDMSLVGPRPNVKRETDLYTSIEKKLLTVKPGITDFSSIVFSDEGDILADKPDPDLAYNQLIRPWKSRLGIFYIEHQSLLLDIRLCFLTALAIVKRETALAGVVSLLKSLGADAELVRIASRTDALVPFPPPGASEIVRSRA
jgi:lipopolysaccharide/colanic/teichoic acid biosynthesis glycosyltransferase